MINSLERMNAEILILQQAYSEELPHKISRIAAAWQALDAGPWDRGAVGTLRRLIHSLAGTVNLTENRVNSRGKVGSDRRFRSQTSAVSAIFGLNTGPSGEDISTFPLS